MTHSDLRAPFLLQMLACRCLFSKDSAFRSVEGTSIKRNYRLSKSGKWRATVWATKWSGFQEDISVSSFQQQTGSWSWPPGPQDSYSHLSSQWVLLECATTVPPSTHRSPSSSGLWCICFLFPQHSGVDISAPVLITDCKLERKEGQWLVQGHMASKWQI